MPPISNAKALILSHSGNKVRTAQFARRRRGREQETKQETRTRRRIPGRIGRSTPPAGRAPHADRQTRERVAQALNTALVLLYWQVGSRLRTEILKQKRAAYGEEILATVSRELSAEFGSGFTDKALWRMVQFAEVFPDRQLVAALSRQLSWRQFVEILP